MAEVLHRQVQHDATVADRRPEVVVTRANQPEGLHRIVVVGGGAAGLELVTRLGDRLGRRRRGRRPRSTTAAPPTGDRGFESISLQRRVVSQRRRMPNGKAPTCRTAFCSAPPCHGGVFDSRRWVSRSFPVRTGTSPFEASGKVLFVHTLRGPPQ